MNQWFSIIYIIDCICEARILKKQFIMSHKSQPLPRNILIHFCRPFLGWRIPKDLHQTNKHRNTVWPHKSGVDTLEKLQEVAGNLRVFSPQCHPSPRNGLPDFVGGSWWFIPLNKAGEYTLGFPMSAEIYQECEEIDVGKPTHSNGTFPPFLPKWYFHIDIICCEIITRRENTNLHVRSIFQPAMLVYQSIWIWNNHPNFEAMWKIDGLSSYIQPYVEID